MWKQPKVNQNAEIPNPKPMLKKKTLALITTACLLAMGANAASISVSTPSGAIEKSGLPVDASATFVTGQNQVLIVLRNNLANPTSVAQLISDISFSLSGGQTSATINSQLTNPENVLDNGHYTIGSTASAGWGVDTAFSGGIHVTALGFVGPKGLIIGPPDASNVYSAANGSIANTGGPHNPFSALEVDFTLNVPGVNADTLVNNIVFSFGTEAGNNVSLTPPRGVPDGGTTVVLLGAALSALGLIRRRLS
jgi:hypothetical protein